MREMNMYEKIRMRDAGSDYEPIVRIAVWHTKGNALLELTRHGATAALACTAELAEKGGVTIV